MFCGWGRLEFQITSYLLAWRQWHEYQAKSSEGKVDPGVSELLGGNELSRDHVNRSSEKKSVQTCN